MFHLSSGLLDGIDSEWVPRCRCFSLLMNDGYLPFPVNTTKRAEDSLARKEPLPARLRQPCDAGQSQAHRRLGRGSKCKKTVPCVDHVCPSFQPYILIMRAVPGYLSSHRDEARNIPRLDCLQDAGRHWRMLYISQPTTADSPARRLSRFVVCPFGRHRR